MGSLRENPVYRSQPFTKEEEEMFSGTLKDGKKETSAVETADPEVISEKTAESTSPEINSEPIKSLERNAKTAGTFSKNGFCPESRSRHRLIGQLFDTYWLVQFEDNFISLTSMRPMKKYIMSGSQSCSSLRNIQSQYVKPSADRFTQP